MPSQRLNICTIALPLEKVKHGPHLLGHGQDHSRYNVPGDGHRRTRLFAKNVRQLLKSDLVPGERDGFPAVLLRTEKRFGGDVANVLCGDELERLRSVSGELELDGCGEELAEEAAVEVVHEGDRPEDGPGHAAVGLCCGVDEVVLDVVLADEVRDVGRVGE